MKSKKNQQAITAMETFMSLPDELLIEMIYKDPEGINVICLALGIELNNIKYAKKIQNRFGYLKKRSYIYVNK